MKLFVNIFFIFLLTFYFICDNLQSGGDTMNERLKLVRAHEKMNQSQFAEALGIGQSTLAMMEVGKREILDRHIKMICCLFHVDEEWFRTGHCNHDDPFGDNKSSIITFSAAHPDMSDIDKALMEAYFSLSDVQKDAFLQYCLKVAEAYQTQVSKKNMAAARSGDRLEVASVSAEDEDAALPPSYSGDI